MTDVITSDRVFDAEQTAVLDRLAELMIPAEEGLPSAADAPIFANVLTRLCERADVVNAGLALVVSISADLAGAAFLTLPATEQLTVVARLRAACPGFVSLFESAVAACYYRDDRVLRSLGLPARAPYPEGNAVEPTDWSMLDSVRARQPFYRSA
jgi:hypothetical protein